MDFLMMVMVRDCNAGLGYTLCCVCVDMATCTTRHDAEVVKLWSRIMAKFYILHKQISTKLKFPHGLIYILLKPVSF